jgi:hypothetical protein
MVAWYESHHGLACMKPTVFGATSVALQLKTRAFVPYVRIEIVPFHHAAEYKVESDSLEPYPEDIRAMYRVGTSVESPQVRAIFRIENSVSQM